MQKKKKTGDFIRFQRVSPALLRKPFTTTTWPKFFVDLPIVQATFSSVQTFVINIVFHYDIYSRSVVVVAGISSRPRRVSYNVNSNGAARARNTWPVLVAVIHIAYRREIRGSLTMADKIPVEIRRKCRSGAKGERQKARRSRRRRGWRVANSGRFTRFITSVFMTHKRQRVRRVLM